MENKNLKHTERLENIFYGDLFKIENKACLIFWYGKTKACRSCLETEKDELGLDFICLTEENNQLYCHNEFEYRHIKVEDTISKKVKIDYFVRMLDNDETEEVMKIFKDNIKKVHLISLEQFIELSKFNITYNVSINPEILTPTNRLKKFIDLVKDKNINCIMVPWCNSLEEKGELLKNFIKNNNCR